MGKVANIAFFLTSPNDIVLGKKTEKIENKFCFLTSANDIVAR